MFYSAQVQEAIEEGVALAKRFSYGDNPDVVVKNLKRSLKGKSAAKSIALMSAFSHELMFRQGKAAKNYLEEILAIL